MDQKYLIEKQELTREYIRKFSNIIHKLLKLAGYSRFTIKNGQIVKKSLGSVVYGVFIIIWAISTLCYILYDLAVVQNYMFHAEIVLTIQISMLVTSFVVKITFASRDSGAKLLNNCIEIDLLLGKKNTQFLRDLEEKTFLVLTMPIFINQLTLLISLYLTFKVSYLIHVTGSLYFYWLFFAFYDIILLICDSLFISLRTRYLNVALMKITKMEIDHIPTAFFSSLIWTTKYDDRVEPPDTADEKTFLKAFMLIFNQFHYFQECYTFTIFSSVACITLGSLFTVQGMIAYDQTTISVLRKSVIVGWLILSWLVFMAVNIVVDTFSTQINQTKLICIYNQLTASHSESSEAYLPLTKSILRALEVRETRLPIYGVFHVDVGTVFRVAVSTFVYITAYLQLTMTMSMTEEGSKLDNVTSSLQP